MIPSSSLCITALFLPLATYAQIPRCYSHDDAPSPFAPSAGDCLSLAEIISLYKDAKQPRIFTSEPDLKISALFSSTEPRVYLGPTRLAGGSLDLNGSISASNRFIPPNLTFQDLAPSVDLPTDIPYKSCLLKLFPAGRPYFDISSWSEIAQRVKDVAHGCLDGTQGPWMRGVGGKEKAGENWVLVCDVIGKEVDILKKGYTSKTNIEPTRVANA